MASQTLNVNTPVRFTLSVEDIPNGVNGHGESDDENAKIPVDKKINGDEKQPGNIPKSKSASRFTVARVEFAEEPRKESPPKDVEAAAPAAKDGPIVNGDHEPLVNGDHSAGNEGKKPAPRLYEKKPSVSVDSSTTSPPYSPNAGSGDTYQPSYETQNLKTFGKNTLETLPNLDHYRNVMSATGAMKKRPTLLELHEQDVAGTGEEGEHLLGDLENGHVKKTKDVTEEVKVTVPAGPKFGWVKGVLVRCLLNIYGVMLFLRLSWVVGQSGIGLSALVILLSTVVTVITALSMSAICTNGTVRGGGAYFMISRSLGPEFGGAIGLIFSMANAVAVAMYVVGFAEIIRDILVDYDCLMVDAMNDVRIIGIITIIFLLTIALIGMEWEARAQMVLLGILIISIVNFIVGTLIPPTETKRAKGFVGYQTELFYANLGPDFRDGNNFFSVFSIFFPAATGILAGANISGDLQDAQKSIPKGTLLAILISSVTYVGMAWMAGACILRDAAGPVLPLVGENVTNATLVLAEGAVETLVSYYSGENGSQTEWAEETCAGNCSYGLQNDMRAMELASAYGPLTIAGIISATLSSALASLVSAPKVFQAVGRDRIFPLIHVFAKGYGKAEEPRRAYILTFFIGAAFICVGSLNNIAPLISNFFLMSYALINYSCFDASLAKSPGWRPAFRFYSMWMSLLGAILCLAVMFIINWWAALMTFACVAALYVYVHYRKPDINWGSSTQAHVYRSALQHTLKLSHVLDHIKNYRPQLLVLSGFPRDRQILVDFGSNISKNISLMVCGHVVQDSVDNFKNLRNMNRAAYSWLNKRKSRAFYCGVTAPNLRDGCRALLQCVGTGKMKPNTILIGFKCNWRSAKPTDIDDYYNIINDAFDLHYAVGILRIQDGLDFSHITQNAALEATRCKYHLASSDSNPLEWSPMETAQKVTEEPSSTGPEEDEDDDDISLAEDSSEAKPEGLDPKPQEPEGPGSQEPEGKGSDSRVNEACIKSGQVAVDINRDILNSLNRFHRKQKRGTIDVWWMFDDGGLTLLIPYILSTKSYWEGCKLRVFMAGTKKMELDHEQRQMATMLSKFRIEYSSMKVIPDIGKRPHKQNIEEFQALIKDYVLDREKGETEETHPWKVSSEALQALKDKTNRQIRLRELLLENSRDAALIVMTLPIPRKGLCASSLYLAWVDTLTRDMPPILLLRGNHDSVLTYYS